MNLKSRIKQRGSMSSFIIIGAILVIGLASGMYFLKKHGEQVRQDKIIASIEQKQTNKVKVSEKTPKAEAVVKPSTQISDVLPETGIELDIVQLFGLCFMTMSIYSYLLSRKNQMSHL